MMQSKSYDGSSPAHPSCEQPKAGSRTEGTPMDPILESPGARQHTEEPNAALGRLGGSKRVSTMANESAAAPSATAESRAENLAVPREPTALPDALEGMVGPAIRPLSPQVVPPAATEEDKVEEIECDEPRPQSVRILRKRSDNIVIVEEEDTTKEFRRLETSPTGVMRQIKVSTAP